MTRSPITVPISAFGSSRSKVSVPEAEPSPRALARVARAAKRDGIQTVFLENMTDPRLAQALAREAHLTVGPKLYSDSLSALDGPAPTYLDLLRYNTRQLVASMQA